jgi:formylglycine-generating enzyme required for sulfatase activity
VARVFLSYAREDVAQVRGIYRRLIDAGFEVWMDKINLLPGQRWQQEIPRAIRSADFILIFFSKNSVAKQGYVQREFRLALETLEEMPPEAIHTIPIRLDDCQIPEQFHHLQWSNFSEEGAFDRIVQALRLGMEQRQHFTPEPALKPPPDPKTWTNSIGMEFMLIPAGTFLMGSPDSYREANDNEKPVHQVTISQVFYLGKYPVTQAQWEAIMGDENPSQFKHDPTRPVERVSWHGALAFLRKLTEREGGGDYRLPTEAQWEYACRAGTKTPRYHPDCNAIAWYDGDSNGYSQPVGQKLPNAWGLHDMLGNVYEWCLDGRRQYTAAAAVDPIGPTDAGANRVIRGGSWDHSARFVRAALRDWYPPDTRSNSLGFRCACSGRR